MYSGNTYPRMPTSSRGPCPTDYSLYDYNFIAHQQQYSQRSFIGRPQNCIPGQHPGDWPGPPQHPTGPPKNNYFKDRTRAPKPISNSHHEEYRIYKCPGCSLYFDCQSRNNRYTGRVPLVLNCRHTVCQECIYKGALDANIVCPTCNKPSELTKKHLIDDLSAAFPPNYYIFGVIMWGKPQGNSFKSPTLIPAQVKMNNRKLGSGERSQTTSDPGEKCCFVSCTKRATLKCQDCNDIYCIDCCTAIHKSAKSLWSHVQVQITNVNFSVELEQCREHNMDIEFLCVTCDGGACCYCFIEKHEGHEKEHLSKLSNGELTEFQMYREKAEKVLKQLIISQKKIKNLCSTGTSVVESKICQYFTDIHAQLFFIEKNLQKRLTLQGDGNKMDAGLESISWSLESSVNSLKRILSSAANINTKKINLRGLLQKLKTVPDIPCYLLTEDGTISESVEFVVDPILENLDGLFRIKRSVDCKYSLVTEEELPPDYVEDPSDLQYKSDAESCISSLAQTSKKDDKISNRKRQENKRQSGQHSQIPLDNEMVDVTHIESLECFYVQLKKLQSRLMQMNKEIENYTKLGAAEVEQPQISELYLAFYTTKTDQMWCRGRLVDIKNSDEETLYEVFFVDYGSTQLLSIDKLREITPGLAQRKPFAIQCELYNPTYASWSKNAHVYMGKMINGKEVYMMVKNVNSGVYQVDLMVSSSDRGLTSIVDILIHTSSNALVSSSDCSNVSSYRKEAFALECKVFSNSMKFLKDQTHEVVIANVIDPHHIFVHMATYVDSLRKMNAELKQHYKATSSEGCIPIEGTYVVVEYKDSIRGMWHRAFVKKVDVNQTKAHVLLVDWGNNVVVPWTSIRILEELFTKLEAQAILVKLVHVEPFGIENAWTEDARFFLQKHLRTQETLKMIVYNINPLEVALFETSETVDICINAQLVQKKFAISTGKISDTLEWPQNNQEQQGFTEDEGFVATLLKKADEDDEVVSEEEESEVENLVKQKVDIVKVVSPDLIYIKFLHLEKQEIDLHKELQIHFQKERELKTTWQETEDCIVRFSNYYVRGKILEKIEDTYKINVYDKATEIVLPQNKIYIYPDYFRKYPKIVYQSHLARIRPAGGDKWSLSSIEALEKTFEKFKDIYATKVPGDMTNKSMPMLMWYTQVKMGGALEPAVTKFVSINNLLVKLGFAYKQPSTNDETVGEKEKTKLDESMESTSAEIVDQDKSDDAQDVEESDATSYELKKKSTENNDQNNTTASSDWNDIVEEEERQAASKQDSPYHTREMNITDWKPSFSIKKVEFNAWVTCAEPEGILYLRDEDLQEVYKNMEANLKQYFESKPPLKEKPEWHPGQICTIAYKNYWYRGRVSKIISPTEIEAIMIDFGSDHSLKPDQLFREILYPEIPAFASKIKLDRVFAKSGVWLSSDYDTLLDIVTEHSKIVIKGSLDVEVPLAEVYTSNGQSVNELLVEKCPNLTRCINPQSENVDDDSVVIVEEEPLKDPSEIFNNDMKVKTSRKVKRKFSLEPLPKNASKEKILMTVVGMLSYNKVVLKQLTEDFEQLYTLTEEIQACQETRPVLSNLQVGLACICPYAEDGIWYRAQIYDMDGIECGYVFVFFVDFGNVESVSVKDVKMMRPEWYELPVPSYIATVNYTLKAENHLEHISKHMKKLSGKDKLVELVSEDPLCVNLYETNGELCYQSLISNGLLQLN